MAKVLMIVTMSGTRADGRPWPAAGQVLDTEDWEAEHLVRGTIAVPWQEAEQPVQQEEPEPVQQDYFRPVGSPDPSVTPPVEADSAGPVERPSSPKPVQPKADWVAWAVSQGAAEEDVRDLTKAELMERYGDRA